MVRDKLKQLSEEELERLIEKLKFEIKKTEISNLKKRIEIEDLK